MGRVVRRGMQGGTIEKRSIFTPFAWVIAGRNLLTTADRTAA
jgi:hypothetical protein